MGGDAQVTPGVRERGRARGRRRAVARQPSAVAPTVTSATPRAMTTHAGAGTAPRASPGGGRSTTVRDPSSGHAVAGELLGVVAMPWVVPEPDWSIRA